MSREPDRDDTRTSATGPDPSPTLTLRPDNGSITAATPGGWTQPPLLRDDSSDETGFVQTSSPEMPDRASSRYQLLGEIARGGMGVIIKGRDPDLGRDLAIKVLRSDQVGRLSSEQRFVEEAQVGGQLQHPGIVPVYDIGRLPDGRPFFAMKLVKGRTLAELLFDRPNPAHNRGQFLKIFEQIAQTIGYAHSKGVIHRDLKPANIMVGNFGEVQVMDWGLAKVLPRGGIADEKKADAQTKQTSNLEDPPTVINTVRFGSGSGSDTQAGSVLGTPAYMSPEQAGGEIDRLDERVDVFGLGAVLCVILTGRPPYVADDGDFLRLMAIRGKLDGAFERLDSCEADDELVGVCKKCLAPERDDRPRDAGEVALAISAYLAGVEDRARRAELERAAAEARTAEEANTRRVAEAKANEERKRRRVQAALGMSLTAAVVLVGFGLWWQDRESRERKAEIALIQASEQADRDRRLETAERDVAVCLDSVASLIAEARKEGDDPERMRITLIAAKSYAERAEASLAVQAIETLNERMRVVRSNLEQVNQDARLLAAIEIVRMDGSETEPTPALATPAVSERRSGSAPPLGSGAENEMPTGKGVMAARYEEAFRSHGWDILGQPATETIARLREHPHQDRLLTSLANWLRVVDQADHRGRLQDILIGLEAQAGSYRARLQAALAAEDVKELVDLSHAPETIAQPASRVEFVASALLGRGQSNSAIALLRQGVDKYPGDFWLHFALGTQLINHVEPVLRTEAAAELTAAVALRPRSVYAIHNLGAAHARLGESVKALRCYKQALELNPNYSLAHSNVAGVMLAQRKYSEAIESSRRAIELDPNSPYAYSHLLNALKPTHTQQERIAYLRDLANIYPNSPQAHFSLALLHQSIGQEMEMDAEYKHALRLSSSLEAYRFGKSLSSAKQAETAILFMKRAVELQPKSGTLHNDLAIALRDAGNIDDAIREFEEAARASPRWSMPRCNLALTYLDYKKDYPRVIEEADKAIAINPRSSWANNLLGCGLRDVGKTDEAIAQFHKTALLDSKYFLPHRNLAWLYWKQKEDLPGAEKEFKEAVRLAPFDTDIANDFGIFLRDTGKIDAAIAQFQKTAALDPKFVWAQRNLAHIYSYQKRDEDLAHQYWRRAIQLAPKNAEIANDYGIFLRDAGKIDLAIEQFERGISVDPQYPWPHRNVAWLYWEKKNDLPGADKEFEKAVGLAPKDAKLAIEYGTFLRDTGKIDRAIEQFGKAKSIEPNSARPYWELAWLYWKKKNDLPGAEKEFEEAIRLAQKDAKLANSYAWFLRDAGKLDLAIEQFKRVLSIDQKNADARTNLQRTERMRELLPRLTDIIAGRTEPKTPAEACEFGSLCVQPFQKKYANSVRLYEKAFAGDPKLANDLIAGHRYEAACAAALSACGEGVDAPIGLTERAALRAKALKWLRADLALHKKQSASSNVSERKATVDWLLHWNQDSDLSPLRPGSAQTIMTKEESTEWEALWAELSATLAHAQRPIQRLEVAPAPRLLR